MSISFKSLFWSISLLLALAASVSAAPGDLDTTFGNGGIVITNGGASLQLYTAWAMAIQSDGKIVVVGEGAKPPFDNYNWDFTVVRYNPDGSLDSSFGGAGIVITEMGSNLDQATSVAIQADGKIVVAGNHFAVVRYNTNGTLDTSFNDTGKVSTSVGSFGGANSAAIQSDGKIVVAGTSGFGSTSGFALVRYNADGSLDTTFNGTGKVVTPGGGATSVAIQSDGKIVAAGGSGNGSTSVFTLVRYNPDGTLDTSFNGAGKVITPIGNSGSGAGDLAIQTDGKIVAAGYSLAVADNWRSADFAIVRYSPDGSLDTSFGGTGRIIIPDSDLDYAYSLAIQPNGKIVIAGSRSNINYKSAVVRLNQNGSLDTSFNGTGKVTTTYGYAYDHIGSVAIQADGKIVVAGDTGPDEFKDFVVARYQGDDATPTPSPTPACSNLIDCPEFFVRQHYLDFLDREAEPAGLAAWLNVLNDCAVGDLICQHEQRLTTSSAFFGSPEFQLKGYFVFRFYRTAFGRLPDYSEISADMRSVTGQTTEDVYTRKSAFTNSFVQRLEFVTLFNGLPNADYVAALLGRFGLTTISTPDPAQPDSDVKMTLTQSQLVNRLDAGTLTRAQVLRAIADSDQVLQAEFNRAFVAMQYYGYLRRTPETTGYNSWLNYLNTHPQDFREMVRGFVDSIEYRMRFGQP